MLPPRRLPPIPPKDVQPLQVRYERQLPRDLDSDEERKIVDLNRLANELGAEMTNKLDEVAGNMLALNFGDKIEMSDGVAAIMCKMLEDGNKPDGFMVAMSLHKWAKSRIGLTDTVEKTAKAAVRKEDPEPEDEPDPVK